MGVRHEDGVDVTDRIWIGCRSEPAQRPEPRPEQGIGQQPEAIHLDEDRGVTHEPDAFCTSTL